MNPSEKKKRTSVAGEQVIPAIIRKQIERIMFQVTIVASWREITKFVFLNLKTQFF